MFEKFVELIKFNDLTKFIILVAVYTVYLTWWASTITNQIAINGILSSKNSERLEQIIQLSNLDAISLNKTAATLDFVLKKSEEQDKLIQQIVKDHERCSVLLTEILNDYRSKK
jgi:hypothetical protein